MTPRSIRRAAERKAAKIARKQRQQTATAPVANPTGPILGLSQEDSDFIREVEREMVEKAFETRSASERPKAQPSKPLQSSPIPRRCTGPTTPEGKAISCLNRLKHGLTGSFRVLESESQAHFNELRDALRNEHAPATATETLLVDRMAEHVWLSQRAQRLQDDELVNGNEKTFALFLRYQTTNDRAFFKCLRELAALRRERSVALPASGAANEFESQKQPTPPLLPENTPRTHSHSQADAPKKTGEWIQTEAANDEDSSNRKAGDKATAAPLEANLNL